MAHDSYNEEERRYANNRLAEIFNKSKKNVRNIWIDKLKQIIQYLLVQIKVKVISKVSLKIMPREWVIDENNYNLAVRL